MRAFLQKYTYSIILLRQLVKTDFKLRYQGSVLGYLWSLLRPLAIFLILYVVFVRFLGVGGGIPHFPVYLLLGIVLWNFFMEITSGSIASVVGKGDLIRKISFPKYVIVAAGTTSAIINFLINLLVVVVFMIVSGVDINSTALYFPLLILELLFLSTGIAFFLSAAYVKFRDIGYIWEVIVQGAFYATPILYPLDNPVPLLAQKILILNPMAQIIQDARHGLVTPVTRSVEAIYGSSTPRLIPIAITLVVFVAGSIYFKNSSKSFAENV
jgi:ABC-2 type transport system permease protein